MSIKSVKLYVGTAYRPIAFNGYILELALVLVDQTPRGPEIHSTFGGVV
jgi:hypothetical protein